MIGIGRTGVGKSEIVQEIVRPDLVFDGQPTPWQMYEEHLSRTADDDRPRRCVGKILPRLDLPEFFKGVDRYKADQNPEMANCLGWESGP